MIHKLYRVERRVNEGWKLGICVWMEPRHFASFLQWTRKINRVRREQPYNCSKVSFLWDGHKLTKGGQPTP